MSITVKRMLEEIIPKRALKVQDKLQDLDCMIQINAEGEDGGEWVLKLAKGKLEVSPGKSDNPNCMIIADNKIWLELFNGKLKFMKALLFGKLKVQGDKKLALRLTSTLLG